MLKDIDDYQPSVTIIDPLSALLASGTQHQTHGMVLRLIDHLKTIGVTSLFTTLQTKDDETDLNVSSIMDTWILVHNAHVDDDVVRRLHVVKSRGMAHSTKRRVMEITGHGVRLKDEAGLKSI